MAIGVTNGSSPVRRRVSSKETVTSLGGEGRGEGVGAAAKSIQQLCSGIERGEFWNGEQ